MSEFFSKFANDKITTNFGYKQIAVKPMRQFSYIIICMASLLLLLLPGAFARDNGLRLRTVVIDPGHGGKDPGSISKDKKTLEKNLTLSISKRFAAKIREAYPEIKVVLTRDKDEYLPLVDRAKIANNLHADLFVSIHINAVNSSSPNGFSSHILGQSSKKNRDLYQNNFDECVRENSVVLLEDDYTTNYQGFDPDNPESSILFSLIQNAHLEQSLQFACLASEKMSGGPFRTSRGVRQDPFLVLWKTAMPSVLLECGFISNASDLEMLRSSEGIEAIADKLLQTFAAFKESYYSNAEPITQENAQPRSPEAATESVDADNTWYGTQILALKKLLKSDDPALKGLETEIIHDSGIYRYIAGRASTPEQAAQKRKEIRQKFPEAFAVKVKSDKVERYK